MAGIGDIALSSNFNISSQRPLDARQTVADIVGRDAIPTIKRYDGLETYLEDTKQTYRMVLGTVDTNLANNSNWVDTTIVLGTTNISNFVNDANYVTGGSTTNISEFINDVNYTSTGDNISEFTNDANYTSVGDNISTFTNDANYTSTGDNISEFVNDLGYITGYTETDPIFTASPASGITSGNITNWNTAFGWGNHALAGYLTSITTLTPGDGISGTAYNGTVSRTFNLSYGGSGGDSGISLSVARYDHIHSSYISSFATGNIEFNSGFPITDPINVSYADRVVIGSYVIVNLNIALGSSTTAWSVTFDSTVALISSSIHRPDKTITTSLVFPDSSGNTGISIPVEITSIGYVKTKNAAQIFIPANVYLQGSVTYIKAL